MYSQSNSFLGGANSARPAPGQFGQQSFTGYGQPQQQQQQQQQQPNGFAPQQTGFPGAQLQPQFTGYPPQAPQQQSFQAPQQQQPQFTGYPPQSQPPPQQPIQPPSQPSAPAAAPLRPQQTSAQIAQSFAGPSATPATPAKTTKTGGKIPNIRLSFITATDQAKFEQLFKSAVGDNQAIDGMYDPRYAIDISDR